MSTTPPDSTPDPNGNPGQQPFGHDPHTPGEEQATQAFPPSSGEQPYSNNQNGYGQPGYQPTEAYPAQSYPPQSYPQQGYPGADQGGQTYGQGYPEGQYTQQQGYGYPGQSYPQGSYGAWGEPSKKKGLPWWAWLLIALVAIGVIGGGAFAIFGLKKDSDEKDEPTPTATETTVEPTEEPTTEAPEPTEEPTTEAPEPTEEPTTEAPKPAGDITTKFTSPDFGKPMDFEDLFGDDRSARVTINSIEADAWSLIEAESTGWAEPPEPGMVYFLVNLTVENTGTEEFAPWLEAMPELVGAEGQVTTYTFTEIPDDLSDMGSVKTGESLTGNLLLVGNESLLNTSVDLEFSIFFNDPITIPLD